MTSFENPKAIRHFQSICDSCQDLVTRFHTPSDLKLFSDGYLQALRNCNALEQRDQEKLERLIERWILDPSSFIDPNGGENKGFFDKKIFKILIFINLYQYLCLFIFKELIQSQFFLLRYLNCTFL